MTTAPLERRTSSKYSVIAAFTEDPRRDVRGLNDDDFGNLFVFHSDTTHRHVGIWKRLIEEENHERIVSCLARMETVNNLAILHRKEVLTNTQLDGLEGRIAQSDVLLAETEFEAWRLRADRFSLRVELAKQEFAAYRRASGATERDLTDLIDAVGRHLAGETDIEELTAAYDAAVRSRA